MIIKNKIFIILNIIEAIYICYMFNFFKTKYSVHLSWEYLTQKNSFLKHPIKTGNYESKICLLGNLVGWLLPFWIFFRMCTYLYKVNNKVVSILNYTFWGIIFILSFLMNLNAFIYLIPVFILETIFGIFYK